MLAVRIILAPLIVPAVAAAPYLAFGYYTDSRVPDEAGVPSFGALMFAVVLIGALLTTIFLIVARVGWKNKAMVVRQHLYGWPVGIALLFFLLLVVPSWLEGFSAVIALAATSVICAAIGIAAAALWLRLSYPYENTG